MGMIYGWIPPRARKQPKRDSTFTPLKQPINPRLQQAQENRKKYQSVGSGIGNAIVKQNEKYNDEQLAQREREAREVKHTIAPICNKGGYQLITNSEDIKTAGRKV